MSDSEAKDLIVFVAIVIVVEFLAVFQLAGTTAQEWEEASKACAHGVEKVYLDGDYRCKEAE